MSNYHPFVVKFIANSSLELCYVLTVVLKSQLNFSVSASVVDFVEWFADILEAIMLCIIANSRWEQNQILCYIKNINSSEL